MTTPVGSVIEHSGNGLMANALVGRQWRAFTDCCSTGNTQEFFYTVSGTGAALNGQASGTDNAFGILRLALGTVATSRGAIHSNVYTILNFGKGRCYFATRIRHVTLSDATNAYTDRFGFIDSITGESVDGAFFRYTHSVNGGRFQAVTRSNNTETLTDTGITVVANTFYKLVVVVNAAGGSVSFFIDDVPVATITTNIPTGTGRDTGYGDMVLRSLGTAAVNALDFDYLEVVINSTTER